jgi:hypothetical protein
MPHESIFAFHISFTKPPGLFEKARAETGKECTERATMTAASNVLDFEEVELNPGENLRIF